jgi:hypothetical protein
MGLGMRRAVGTTVAAQFQHDSTEVVANINLKRNSRPVSKQLATKLMHCCQLATQQTNQS